MRSLAQANIFGADFWLKCVVFGFKTLHVWLKKQKCSNGFRLNWIILHKHRCLELKNHRTNVENVEYDWFVRPVWVSQLHQH